MSSTNVMVVTDSSASLPDSLKNELNIQVIPLWLVWDGESYQDGVDIDPPTFYQRLRDSSSLPSSTQPSVEEFKEFFKNRRDSCSGFVCVLASSKISGTVDSALAAKEQVPQETVKVVDSLFTAMGQGIIVAAAARAAAAASYC